MKILSKITDALLYALLGLSVCALIAFITMLAVGSCYHRETKIDVKTDTIVVHDTIVRIAPQEIEEKPIGKISVKFPIAYQLGTNKAEHVPDSAYMYPHEQIKEDSICLDITQKHYKDSLYEAWVSGYLPKLDSIKVYPTNNYIYKTITKTEYTKRKKWNLGVGVGYGYNGREFSPYIGVGVQYKILEW